MTATMTEGCHSTIGERNRDTCRSALAAPEDRDRRSCCSLATSAPVIARRHQFGRLTGMTSPGNTSRRATRLACAFAAVVMLGWASSAAAAGDHGSGGPTPPRQSDRPTPVPARRNASASLPEPTTPPCRGTFTAGSDDRYVLLGTGRAVDDTRRRVRRPRDRRVRAERIAVARRPWRFDHVPAASDRRLHDHDRTAPERGHDVLVHRDDPRPVGRRRQHDSAHPVRPRHRQRHRSRARSARVKATATCCAPRPARRCSSNSAPSSSVASVCFAPNGSELAVAARCRLLGPPPPATTRSSSAAALATRRPAWTTLTVRIPAGTGNSASCGVGAARSSSSPARHQHDVIDVERDLQQRSTADHLGVHAGEECRRSRLGDVEMGHRLRRSSPRTAASIGRTVASRRRSRRADPSSGSGANQHDLVVRTSATRDNADVNAGIAAERSATPSRRRHRAVAATARDVATTADHRSWSRTLASRVGPLRPASSRLQAPRRTVQLSFWIVFPGHAGRGSVSCSRARDQSGDGADDQGVTLAAAAAQRSCAGAPAAPAQLAQQRQGQAVAAHPDRVTEGDRPPVDVDDVR